MKASLLPLLSFTLFPCVVFGAVEEPVIVSCSVEEPKWLRSSNPKRLSVRAPNPNRLSKTFRITPSALSEEHHAHAPQHDRSHRLSSGPHDGHVLASHATSLSASYTPSGSRNNSPDTSPRANDITFSCYDEEDFVPKTPDYRTLMPDHQDDYVRGSQLMDIPWVLEPRQYENLAFKLSPNFIIEYIDAWYPACLAMAARLNERRLPLHLFSLRRLMVRREMFVAICDYLPDSYIKYQDDHLGELLYATINDDRQGRFSEAFATFEALRKAKPGHEAEWKSRIFFMYALSLCSNSNDLSLAPCDLTDLIQELYPNECEPIFAMPIFYYGIEASFRFSGFFPGMFEWKDSSDRLVDEMFTGYAVVPLYVAAVLGFPNDDGMRLTRYFPALPKEVTWRVLLSPAIKEIASIKQYEKLLAVVSSQKDAQNVGLKAFPNHGKSSLLCHILSDIALRVSHEDIPAFYKNLIMATYLSVEEIMTIIKWKFLKSFPDLKQALITKAQIFGRMDLALAIEQLKK